MTRSLSSVLRGNDRKGDFVEMNKEVIIRFNREEALACAIALAKEKKPYGWQRDALAKVDKALGVRTLGGD